MVERPLSDKSLRSTPSLADDIKKLCYSGTVEASMPNIGDTSDPKFGSIRVWLARTYLEHKGDLGVLLTDDTAIVAHVDEITALLLAASERALRADNQCWKERYRWFFEAIAEPQDALLDRPLDG